jgi:hypothetical protein
VFTVAAVLVLGRSSILELVPLEVCVVPDSSSSELVDVRPGKPPAELKAVALDLTVTDTLPASSVDVTTSSTRVLVEPQT